MKNSHLHKLTYGKPGIKVLVDADILIELFINRSGFVEDAEKLLQILEDQKYFQLIEVFVTDKCLRRIRLEMGEFNIELGEQAVDYVEKLLNAKIIPIDGRVRQWARESPLRDFDSAEEVVYATIMNLDAIITQNSHNFDGAKLPIWSVTELMERLELEKILYLSLAGSTYTNSL